MSRMELVRGPSGEAVLVIDRARALPVHPDDAYGMLEFLSGECDDPDPDDPSTWGPPVLPENVRIADQSYRCPDEPFLLEGR